MMRCPVCNGDALVRDASVPVLGNRPCDACEGTGEVDSWKMVAACSLVASWSGIVCVTTLGDRIHRETLEH